MTKPKIANGNCLNPLGRLEKRFDEYRRCHQTAITNCNKIQESHNKSNDALKALLERKSKLSDSKIKKKRSALPTAINRKKPKLAQEQLQSVNNFFDNKVELTPNVTLNVHASEIPDIDWDNLDILNNPNFSMSINEQELEGVLNNCYSQTLQTPDTKISSKNPSNGNLSAVCKTSPNIQINDLFTQNNVNNFKPDDPIFPPLFPSPEQNPAPLFQQEAVKYEYLSPPNYRSNTTTCNYNPVPNIHQTTVNHHANPQSAPYNSQNAMYAMNLPPSVNPNNNLSYQYHTPTIVDQIPTNNSQYFYQYSNYTGVGNINEQTNNMMDNFQLPTMSSGWYNNNNNMTAQIMKPTNCKQPEHFPNNNYLPIDNYRTNSYAQYQQIPTQQTTSQIQYQHMYTNPPIVNSQSAYDQQNHASIAANFTMIPEQQTPQQYYYVDYANNTNGTLAQTMPHNNRSIIDPNESRFQLSHQTNPVLCRNIYQ